MKTSTPLLLSALRRAASTTAGLTTLPILSCVRLCGEDGRLSIQSTDGQQWSEIFIDCDGPLSPLCVNPVLLINSICESEEVTMELKASKLHVESSASAQISVLPVAEFPEFPADKAKAVGLNLTDLATGIRAVAWAACEPNSGRDTLENVHVLAKPKELRVESTEGHMLARWSMAAVCAETEFLVRAVYAQRLADEMECEKAKLSVGEKFICVKHADGRYLIPQPNSQYVSEESLNSVAFNGKKIGKVATQFLSDSAIRTLQLFGPDSKLSPSVMLEWSENTLSASLESETASFKQTLGGKFEEHRVKLSAEYLKMVCHAMKEKEVALEFKDNLSPVRFSAGNLSVWISRMVWN